MSVGKKDRLQAADAITALRFFGPTAQLWLTVEDTIDQQCRDVGLAGDGNRNEVEEEEGAAEESALLEPPGPNDPETLWLATKKLYQLESASMDELMTLIGLKNVF